MSENGWRVRNQRPEEIFSEPGEYFDEEEIEKYSNSSGMERAQKRRMARIVELLEAKPPAKILDIGCGVGYSMEFLRAKGYEVVGLDVLEAMVERARERGLEVKRGDMKNLKNIFEKNTFDFVVSTSAVQWIKGSKNQEKVAKGVFYILKPKGKVGIHFYPKSEEEMKLWGRTFKSVGFKGNFVVDNPNNPKKRNIYLIATK